MTAGDPILQVKPNEPVRCVFCGSLNVDGELGWYTCRACGKWGRYEVVATVTEEAIERLKTATQLLPGAMIHWKGGLEHVHQVVFDMSSEKVSILGVEIWNEAADDVNFVPWHAVELVIPPREDGE